MSAFSIPAGQVNGTSFSRPATVHNEIVRASRAKDRLRWSYGCAASIGAEPDRLRLGFQPPLAVWLAVAAVFDVAVKRPVGVGDFLDDVLGCLRTQARCTDVLVGVLTQGEVPENRLLVRDLRHRLAASLAACRVARIASAWPAEGSSLTCTTSFTARSCHWPMSPRWEPDPDARRGRSVVYNLHAHLVFTPKYRRGVSGDAMLQRCEQIMRDVCTGFGAGLREFNEERSRASAGALPAISRLVPSG